MSNSDGDSIVFTPFQALEWGSHTLRLVENTPDGSILERGLWTFAVRKSPLFREADIRGNIDLDVSRRISEKDETDLPDRLQSQGILGLNANVAEGNWQTTGIMQLSYNSQSDQMFNGREFDLGEYLLSGHVGSSELNVGHHELDQRSLLIDGFHRRGISTALQTENQRAKITGFMMRTDVIQGFRHGLGVVDSKKRLSGIIGTVQPLRNAPEKLFLSLTYFKGEGEETGVGIGGDPASAGGDAWGIITDMNLFESHLRLRGEFAATRFDLDGSEKVFESETDQAYSLLAHYSAPEKPFRGEDFVWSMGLGHQQVGTFFHSQANPGLPNDKRMTHLFGNINWAGWRLDADVGRETDNVEKITFLPTIETDQAILQLAYVPQSPLTGESGWGPFKWPMYQASLSRTTQRQIKSPADFLGIETDHRTKSISISASFNPDGWNWSTGHVFTRFDDASDFSTDYQNMLTYLNAAFQISEPLSIRTGLEWNIFDDKDFNLKTTSLTTRLGLEFFLSRLNGSFDISLNQERASDDSIDRSTWGYQASFNWRINTLKPNRPFFSLYVNGSYDETEDVFSASTRQYQVFSGIRGAWLPAY